MIQAWRERDRRGRIQAAEAALQLDSNCSSALILLAEEKAQTVTEAEGFLLRALNGIKESRDHTVYVYIKRRLGMCARRLGRVKEATKVFKELNRDTVGNFIVFDFNLTFVLIRTPKSGMVKLGRKLNRVLLGNGRLCECTGDTGQV